MDIETTVFPPEVDEDGGDSRSVQISVGVSDLDDRYIDVSLQLFDDAAESPQRFADALLRLALSAAQLRGTEHAWALTQRLIAFDGTT